MNSLIPQDLMTAQDAARIHDQHNSDVGTALAVAEDVRKLLDTHVRPAARTGTSVTLTVPRPHLTREVAAALNSLGYSVTMRMRGRTPTGVLELSWPARPQTNFPGGRPPPPTDPVRQEDAAGPLTRFISNLLRR